MKSEAAYPLWGPFLCIYEGPCNIGASFWAPQIKQYICLPIGSCLVEDKWPQLFGLNSFSPQYMVGMGRIKIILLVWLMGSYKIQIMSYYGANKESKLIDCVLFPVVNANKSPLHLLSQTGMFDQRPCPCPPCKVTGSTQIPQTICCHLEAHPVPKPAFLRSPP